MATGNKDERGELENWFAILSPMGEAGAGNIFWGNQNAVILARDQALKILITK